MGAKRYEDLVVYQLANELHRAVCEITASGAVARDFRFRDQLRDASASAPRNIAEGFARYRPKEFARFLQIARGSLAETDWHLQDGLARGYFSADIVQKLRGLCGRTSIAALRLIQYLHNAKRD